VAPVDVRRREGAVRALERRLVADGHVELVGTTDQLRSHADRHPGHHLRQTQLVAQTTTVLACITTDRPTHSPPVRPSQCLVYDLRTRIHESQPDSFITLTFRSHHETSTRRSWYSVLPDLDATISCHIKKTVVGVTLVHEFLNIRDCVRQLGAAVASFVARTKLLYVEPG